VLPRPTTSKFGRQLGWTAGVCFAAASLSASPALASSTQPTTAACDAQKYSQPFTAFKDFNYYTLAPGGEFNSSSEGWTLSGGAEVIQTTRPSGAAGGVLDLPAGSQAISPPQPITLQDRTARVWVRDASGAEGVSVSVSYLNTDTWLRPKNVGRVHGQHSSWTLSTPFNTQPETAGPEEGVRIVRFVFEAAKNNETQLFGLWVDPRMRGESRMAVGALGCGATETNPSSGSTSLSGTGGSTGTTPSLGGTLVRGVSGGETPVGIN